MARLLILALLGSTLACDPCAAAAAVHEQRCAAGDSGSCDWLAGYHAAGTCPEAPAPIPCGGAGECCDPDGTVVPC